MPWDIIENEPRCPATRPWGVVKQGPDHTLEGCHPTKQHAESQQRALYANEPQRSAIDAHAVFDAARDAARVAEVSSADADS